MYLGVSYVHKPLNLVEAGCSQEEGPKKGFVMGSRTQVLQEILEQYIEDVLTPISLSWGKGHMEEGHLELFCVATAVQLISGMVI